MGLWRSPKISINLYTDNGMNGGPKRCVPPEHGNRAVSGQRVFVDVVKDLKVRSRVRVTFNPTDRVLLRDETGHR